MSELRKELSDEVLAQAVGGAGKSSKGLNRKADFEKAWKLLKMDDRGFSGMKMAEIYDDWELSGFEQDAVTYLMSV